MISMLTIRAIDIAEIDIAEVDIAEIALAEPTTAHIAATEATQAIEAIVIMAITTADIIITTMIDLQDMAIGATADATSLLKLLF